MRAKKTFQQIEVPLENDYIETTDCLGQQFAISRDQTNSN